MKKIVIAVLMILGVVNMWMTGLVESVYATDAETVFLHGNMSDAFTSFRNIMDNAVAGGAALGVVWAGITYLTAGDNEGKVATAKRRLFEIFLGYLAYFLIIGVGGNLLFPS